MRRKIVLFLSVMLLLLACKGTGKKPKATSEIMDDVSLTQLEVNGESVLEKLDEALTYSFGVFNKYSVEVKAVSKTANAIISVGTDNVPADGQAPSFVAYLEDGENALKIISASTKNKSNQKVYTVKISKQVGNVPDTSSSRLKELKVDNVNVLSKMSHNVCVLDDVNKEKTTVKVSVQALNAQAGIKVKNANASVMEGANGSYDVSLHSGLNIIKVIVTSEMEGARCYAVKIYKPEELSLATFKVDDKEYYDEDKDKLRSLSITFSQEKQSIVVKTKAKDDNVNVRFKVNGSELFQKGDAYIVGLVFGKNVAEVAVVGGDGKHSRVYNIDFYRNAPESDASLLAELKAEGRDLLPLLSGERPLTLKAVSNEKASLKLEAKASGATVKVRNGSVEVSESGGTFNVPLNEGANRIGILLYKGDTLCASYSLCLIRNPKQTEVPTPASDEVTVNIFVSDGLNGTMVNGTTLNIFKTKENSSTPLKTLTIIDGKAKVNLKKKEFYDFKLSGLNDDSAYTRYASSHVISQYIDEQKTVLSIIQSPLLRIMRPTQAPEMKEFKFGSDIVAAGSEVNASSMKKVSVKLHSSSLIEKTDFGTPSPMLGVGFVPFYEASKISEAAKTNGVVDGKMQGSQKKVANDKYESTWVFTSHASLIQGDFCDIVVVAYDKACNRLEYHSRVKVANTTEENALLSLENLKLEFKRIPTPASKFAVGEDAGTGARTHYSAIFSCNVTQGRIHVECVGFDIYRKCVTDGDAAFRLAKHIVYDLPRTSNDTTKHFITDTDGVLEDEKTYQYKLVAYTSDGKKSSLDSSPTLSLTVPKSNTVVLEYPVDASISKSEADQMGYKFRLTNPKVLQTAKEMRAGFIIMSRIGLHYWGVKFKYVFNEGGKPEIYFAQIGDELTEGLAYLGTRYSLRRSDVSQKSVDELISVDKDKGEVTIHSNFFSIDGKANLAIHGFAPPYSPGDVYYWDIVDFGTQIGYSFEDKPLEIISDEVGGVTVISPAKDARMGNNSWNGRAEFTIKAR